MSASRFEPSFKRNDAKGPAECEARDSNGNVEEHHRIYSFVSTEVLRSRKPNTITPSPHRGNSYFFSAGYKRQTAACEEKASESFCRRPRGEDRTGRTEPDKKVGKTS
jgi:hypothetical protein